MRIMNNISSLNAWRNLSATDHAMGKNLERLSSGFRINSAADDVAGLAISENMRAQIKGLNQAVKNAQDGISLLQTAEGSLNETHNMLHRMRELALQAANGTLQPEDRKQIQTEMDNLAKEITRITNATQFNSMDLIDGSLTAGGVRDITLQIGPNQNQTVTFAIGAMDASSLGIARDVLTGQVDNGDVFDLAAADGTAADGVGNIDSLGTGLDTGKTYRLQSNAAGTRVELQASSDGGVTWSMVGDAAFAAGGTDVQIGNVATGEFVQVDFAGALTASTTQASIDANHGNVVKAVGEIGAGVEKGSFQVDYDSTTQKVQLQTWNASTAAWENVGAAVDFKAGEKVVLGDKNTARTIEVTFRDAAPGATISDNLTIASTSGRVKQDDTDLVATSGVTATGTGLKSGLYQVVVDAAGTSVQLQDMNGNAIGAAQTYTAGATITLGDDDTNRTVTLTLGAAGIAAGDTAFVEVKNNEQHAAAAKFTGGTKQLNAQSHAGLNVSSVDGATKALAAIDAAIGKVSYQRSQLGAIQNRLDHTISNLNVVAENLTASESRIRDVDMAMEMATFTKHQILMQSGTAMLAQANQKNQGVLQLLR